ncbi:FK506-binding protein 5 [Dendrobium catenatum]|uniref:FK506-binding protein 5 n=1 Tax=Dendrobium catenatum TaxID=906689 RepID=UPI0009F6E303|nr:FK506-binding protein 5 [Dendrobium catenatum]
MAVEIPVDRALEPNNGELSVASSPIPKPTANPQEEMRAVARVISDQPLPNPEPGVWAVLTAISKNARFRPQGVNMLLTEDEHCIGRCVEDRFQINSISISANHCKIYRERETHTDGKADSSTPFAVYLRDTSTNGTYVNWVKLRRSSKVRLTHGDIVSFVSPPLGDNSYVFVYREVPSSSTEGSKRKSEDFSNESKRLKGIGIGAPDGPISLDDVRSLQRSNMELRQQLESHVLTIEALHSENRAINARHENELKGLKDTVSNSYDDQIKDLLNVLEAKQKELDDLKATSAELQNSIKDLNERLHASLQSRADADEIINSQNVTISELDAQLDEERNQRRGEREKAEMDLKSAIQKAHVEAQEEIKRQADVYLRQNREQQELITKLQESEKDSRLLVDMLRSKLEDARESLVTSEKKSRQLEAQFQDELVSSANSRKKMDAVESEIRKLRKELENEKQVAREEAWAKVSSLELEIAAAIRDISIEKQRFQGARERIILRETQLRAFYSTTEEISALFSKQQEQLKAMQKALEDEENYENSLFVVDLNMPVNLNFNLAQPRGNPKESSSASTQKNSFLKIDSKDDCDVDDDDDEAVCTTQKNDCQNDSQDGNTQDLQGGGVDRLASRGFGSDIDGVGTEIVPDLNQNDTERVIGTESQVDERGSAALALLKCSNLAGDTMQIDEEIEAQVDQKDLKTSPSSQQRKEDTEASTIRTADLLASEAAGSWAIDTAPSVYGENESPEDHGTGAEADAATAFLMLGSEGQAAGSQSNSARGITKLTREHRALSAMIDIVEPDFKQKFPGFVGVTQSESPSDAETEEGSNHSEPSDKNDNDSDGDSSSDDATNGAEVMIEDSVG